ncbi:ABC transporter ATP-binding protein [Thalassospira sp.]|uniref:ABC transporter ATP-binding protein n=1 Tax=Thalassospira sp. TaxID=1912094 RepID=UPI002733C5E2|nr:ABC transporter ATP-binding protein [Thalassospira sp.]MDP2700392.1 ABC transporter ATP-binding protein [Thalassospira sp.]
MIEIDAVTRCFGENTVLDNVSLVAEEGSFLALLGPSGCGKSTLLRLIAGLDDPDAGCVRIKGRDISGLSAVERNVAMVFQSYALYPHLSVAENIGLPLAMRELSRIDRSPLGRVFPASRQRRSDTQARVKKVAASVGISDLLDRKPGALSGGQKQRVALARALVRDPSVFLLDEPLSNLDAKLRVQMRAEIVALNRATGRTFIHVTHDQVEAMSMADRVAVMLGGRVAQFGTPRELYETPSSRDVAAFVGTHPITFVSGPKSGGLHPIFHGVGVPSPSGPVVIGIRPEHLTPAPQGPITGRLHNIEYQGAEVLLDVICDTGITLRATATGDWQPPTPGSEIHLACAPVHMHVFDADSGARLEAGHKGAASCA